MNIARIAAISLLVLIFAAAAFGAEGAGDFLPTPPPINAAP